MVSNCGVVKLTDFGLARAMDRSSITSPGFVKGKLSYLAPELTYEAEPSAQTDVFSTGVVLWEVLAGEKLVKDKDPLKVVGAIRDMEIPDLTEFRDDLPTGLQEIIRQGSPTQSGRTLRLEPRDGTRPRRPPAQNRRSHRRPRDRPKRALGAQSTRPHETERARNQTIRRTRSPTQRQLRRRNHPPTPASP